MNRMPFYGPANCWRSISREIEIISFGWFHGTFMPQRYFGSFHIHQNEDGADHIERTAAEP